MLPGQNISNSNPAGEEFVSLLWRASQVDSKFAKCSSCDYISLVAYRMITSNRVAHHSTSVYPCPSLGPQNKERLSFWTASCKASSQPRAMKGP